MKSETPKFRTPEALKWLFVGLILLPIGMMANNAYVALQGENTVLGDEKGALEEEVSQLKVQNHELGASVDGLEVALAEARVENERLVAAKKELVEEIGSVRVEIAQHESREDSLQRVIDLLKNEIVANERKINGLRRESQIAAQAFRRMGASEVASGADFTPEMAEKNYFELMQVNQKLARQSEANDRQSLELLSEISDLNTEINHFKSTQGELRGKIAELNQELLEKRAVIDAIALRQAKN